MTLAYGQVVFPEDRRLWTPQSRGIMATHPDQTGVYSAPGLPEGRYLVAALDFLPPGDERDPKMLERLRARGSAIALRAGEPAALDLELGP